MTSDELVAFIERKFEEHGVSKIIPTDDVLEQHARRMLERHTVLRELDRLLPEIRKQVAETTLPEDLRTRVAELLEESPELPWDAAVAVVMSGDEDRPRRRRCAITPPFDRSCLAAILGLLARHNGEVVNAVQAAERLRPASYGGSN